MELSQYLDLFVSEAQDHLQEMNRALLALEDNPDHLAQLEAFFRAAHTLKGMSATMGFQRMATLSHDMEDVLDSLRRKGRQLDAGLADVLFRTLDTLTGLLQGIAAGEGERIEIAAVQELLNAAQEAPAHTPTAATAVVPEAGWEVLVTIAPDCTLKGPRAFLVQRQLSAVAPLLGSAPPEEGLRAGQYERSFSLFLPPEADPEELRRRAEGVSEVTEVIVRQLGAPRPAQSLPIGPGEPSSATGAAMEDTTAAAESAPVTTAATPVVRIKVTLLDQLLEAVADLMIARSHLAQIAQKQDLEELREVLEAQIQAVDLLQQTVLTMRMTPVGQVFNRFPRMVRDLAHQQGKEVRLEMEGLEIELDRTILEKITDPLVHMLRNAVDHGVEPPGERRKAGKPLPARLTLRARRERDKATIQLSDDGGGMSAQHIAQIALEREVVSPQQLSEMDDASILELICRPGFSTRSTVTGVSGRGVGMEVVKAVLDEIGGSLEIQSQPGEGTSFQMVFPLTMAILPALLVRVREEVYALPLTHVVRTIEPLPEQVRWMHDQAVLWWQEQSLPLIQMADVLRGRIRTGRPTLGDEILTVVVVERGPQRYGLVIDEILGKEEIVLKPLQGMLQHIEGLTGVTIRGEGEVVLVLDIAGLVAGTGA